MLFVEDLSRLVTLFCSVSFTLLGRISYLFLPFYASFSLSISWGVGVRGTAFPVGTVKSLTRGSNQTQTSKWQVSSSSLPIRPEPVSSGWFVPSSPPLLGWGSTRRSWKCWDNETLWGEQRHLPLLLVTLQVCMWNSQPQIQYSESEFGHWCH